MLASTIQFSHNTPTINQHTQTMHTSKMIRHQKKGIMPQTPNNAPTYKQYFSTVHNSVCHKAPFKHSVFVLKVYLPPGISLNNVGSMTLAHSTNTCHQPVTARAQLCPIIKLLRKEVIHPHLPVRVPCYDFVPIADPTFDGSLTSLGHRLRVLPTFMT